MTLNDLVAYSILGTAAWYTIRWIYAELVQASITKKFVYDMAMNHLPHIQKSLDMIADKVGVKLPDAPPIQFIDLKDGDK